jgi:hypothetical protein
MAQPQLEFFKTRGLALKLEVTEGVDSVPTGALNGIMILDGSSGTEFDKVERNIDRPFFTNNRFAVANRRAFIEGTVEIYPPATPGIVTTDTPHIDPLLKIAGMAKTLDIPNKTTTYNPVSSGVPSASAYWWHVDAKKEVLGCRANISSMGMMVGEIPKIQTRIQGKYTSVDEEAIPTIVLPAYTPLAISAETAETLVNCADASITDLLVWAKELKVDFGNALATKEYTSHRVSTISDRLGTWTLRIARADLSDFNPWDVRDNGYIFEAQMTQTYVDTLLDVILYVRGQIETVNEVDIDGDLGWELSGPCIASDTGGDEFTLSFVDNNP